MRANRAAVAQTEEESGARVALWSSAEHAAILYTPNEVQSTGFGGEPCLTSLFHTRGSWRFVDDVNESRRNWRDAPSRRRTVIRLTGNL